MHAPAPGCAATGAARSSLAAAVDLRGSQRLQEKAQGEWPAATRAAALGSGQSAGFRTRNASGPAACRPQAPCRSGSRKRAHGLLLTAAPTGPGCHPHPPLAHGPIRPPPASKRARTGETRIQSGPTRPEVAEDADRAPAADRDPEPATGFLVGCPFKARTSASSGYGITYKSGQGRIWHDA